MKPSNVYIHPQLRRPINALVDNLPHALLLTSYRGVGLHTIAHFIANQTGQAVTEVLTDEKWKISIDVIRELYAQTRSKQQKRIIIIDNAEAMTHAAQNALLKLLEEPGEAISFVLTSHKPDSLLQTIRSRVQHINIPFITEDDTEKLLQELQVTDGATKNQIIFMANGRPAEMIRLVNDSDYLEAQKEIVRDAKRYLQGSAYEKIIVIQKYSTDRNKSQRLLDAALSILEFSLKSRSQNSLIDQLDIVVSTQEKIHENRHIKTQLLRSIF